MRVTILSGMDADGPRGGVQVHVDSLAAALASIGHDVTLVRLGPAPLLWEPRGYRVVSWRPRALLPLSIMLDEERCALAVEGTSPDVVHVHDAYAPLAGAARRLRERGATVVVTIHDLLVQRRPYGSPLGPVHGLLLGDRAERRLLERADRVVACSPAQAERVRAVAGRPVEVVPNGVRLPPPVAPASLPGSPSIVCVGGLSLSKGGDLVIDALAQARRELAGAELTFVGGGPDEQRLRAAARRHRVERAVHFAGHVPEERKWAALRGADIAVLFSRVEPFGIAALEALAVGTPLVAARTGGIPWVTGEDGTARLVPPGDPSALAHSIVEIARDAPSRDRMRMLGPKRAAEFTWERTAQMVSRVYTDALAERSK